LPLLLLGKGLVPFVVKFQADTIRLLLFDDGSYQVHRFLGDMCRSHQKDSPIVVMDNVDILVVVVSGKRGWGVHECLLSTGINPGRAREGTLEEVFAPA
jgi:hypothetical protein